jgi:hypothetical protein
MKQYLRSKVSRMASYIEIFLSALILIGILVFSVSMVKDLVIAVRSIADGSFEFDFRNFIGLMMQIIIGVEFVKMLAKHTPESTVEVLMFVIARKIIVDDPLFNEIAIGVVSIGLLFIIKLYFTQKTSPDGFILEGDTKISELNHVAHTHFDCNQAADLRSLVKNKMDVQRINAVVNAEIIMQDHIFKIYSMREHEIDAIEVSPIQGIVFRWPWQRKKNRRS